MTKEKIIADDKIDDFLKPKKERSQSQKIRDVLFLYWEQNKHGREFEEFYKFATDHFIKGIKDKLK